MEQISTQNFTERQNHHLDFLIDPSFQGVNRLFGLSFENEEDRKAHTGYYLPKVDIKDYKVMTDEKSFFDQPVKSDMRTFDNIQKIVTDKGDDYSTGCLLDYNYFNNHFKMIATNLSKRQPFDADPKAIQKIILLEI